MAVVTSTSGAVSGPRRGNAPLTGNGWSRTAKSSAILAVAMQVEVSRVSSGGGKL
jgi:hypothetical protein